MFQSSYSPNFPAGAIGAEADTSFSDIVTRNNPTDRVLFGHFVTKDTGNDEAIKMPIAAADITDKALLQGIVMSSHLPGNFPEPAASQIADLPPGYPAKHAVPVMRRGRVWVKPEDAVTVGTSSVNVRYAGTGNKGAVRGAAAAGETAVAADAYFRSSTTSGGQLAILELNL